MYDFVIIGGGIIGLSTAVQLITAYPAAKIALLEKEEGLARHQSGHNSGVIHAGVYYRPGSMKARFCRAGNAMIRQFCEDNNIRYDIRGKVLVATTPLEITRLRQLWERATVNGLCCEWMNAEQLREREPNIVGCGGVFIPDSGIVDYAEITRAMARLFCQAGGEIFCQVQVQGLSENLKGVLVNTSSGSFETRYLVSCAGLMADRLVRMLDVEPGFIVCPFRGEYFRLAPQHSQIVNHLIYPVPDPAMPFLGVHLMHTIGGEVTIGPNAVLAFKREGYRRRDFSLKDMLELARAPGIRQVLLHHLGRGIGEMKNSLCMQSYLQEVRKYCPSLTREDLLPYPSGVRAQAISLQGRIVDDFLFVTTGRTIHVCNAPSPAATSAIPIGQHVVGKVGALLRQHAETTRRLSRAAVPYGMH